MATGTVAALRLAVRLSCAALLVGCGSGWHRVTPVPSGALAPRQQVEVWSRGQARRWHAVRVLGDSVSGVPFTRPADCDSCRVQLARADVDSLRLGDQVTGFWQSVLLGLGLGLLACALALGRGGLD